MDRLGAMETFVRVLETGSFSAAARGLGVGQPAVSKSVAQLEERLGVRLLVRTTRGLSATEAGLAFLDRARRAIEEADEADLAARGAGAGLTGRLRVCAPVTFARLHVVPRLPAFLTLHPDLSMEVVLDDRSIDLVEEGIDLALRMGALEDSSLTARRLAAAPRLVVASPGYIERCGEPATPAALAGHEAVVYAQTVGGEAWSFRRDGAETSVRVTGRLRVTAAEGLRAAVLAGAGVAIASAWMFAPELASGEVRVLLREWSLPEVELWAVHPAGRRPSAKARAFAAFVEAQVRASGVDAG